MEVHGSNALKGDEKFTVRDWRTWPAEERWELIHGTAWAMSPAPRLRHQRLVINLAAQLETQLRGKPCEPFLSPVDVYLEAENEKEADTSDTVVQPDLMIVCDPGKCRDTGIFGAPDWVMEILSPSTSYKDQTDKRNLYEKAGVREYWILNPDTLDLLIFVLQNGVYGPPLGATLKETQELKTLPGLVLLAELRR